MTARKWLYQGIRPRWIPLRWWSRAFTDGYRAACADVVSGFVDPTDPDGPWKGAATPEPDRPQSISGSGSGVLEDQEEAQ